MIMSDDHARDVVDESSTQLVTTSGLEDSYWQTLVDSIYSSCGASLDSIEFLIDSLDKLASSRHEALNNAAEFEPFYTCLVCILASKLLERLPTCTVDQVSRMESGAHVLLSYLLQYIKQRSASEEDFSLISSFQALSLIGGLLKAGASSTTNRTSNPSLTIELETLVTLLNSSKVPIYRQSSNDSTNTSSTIHTTNDNEENKSNDKSMHSLISSFLSHDKIEVKSETSQPVIEASSIEKKPESPVELFQKLMYHKFAASHDNLKIILDLLASTLTYLNVYRKNHLKQLRSSSSTAELATLAQIGCLTYEQAIQTRVNCSSLLNDLNQLYHLLLLPIFKSKTLWDKQDISQLEELVHSSQIALLVTNYAQYVVIVKSAEQRLQHQTSTSSTRSYQEDVTFAELNELTNTSNLIVAKYLEVIERIAVDSNYVTQLNSQLAYTMSFFLLKQLSEYNSDMVKWVDQTSLSHSQQHVLNHISYLKPISAKINSLLGTVFQSGDQIKQKLDQFKYPDGQNLFSMLFSLFKTFFLKINILLVTNEHKVATLATVSKQISRVSQHSVPAEIKNIDDDEDDVENADESDDCLLIGSWFEEEPIEKKEDSNEPTTTTSASGPGKSSTSEIVLSSSSKNQTSLEIITLPSVLIYLMERIVDLTRLSGDTEFVAVEYLRQGVQCDDIAFYIKQMSKDCKFPVSITTQFYKLIRYLLVDNVLTVDQMNLLIESLNVTPSKFDLNTASLNANTQALAIMTQVYIIKLVKQSKDSQESTRADILKMWENILDLLKHRITDSVSVNDDLSPEYSAVLLFMFHHLNNDQRTKILLKLSGIMIELNDRPSCSSLYTTRLTTLFHYLTTHFDQPSALLVQTMENSGILNEARSDGVAVASIESIVDIPYLAKIRSMGDSKRPNYSFVTPDLFISTKACSSAIDILRGGLLDYDKLYTALIELAYCGNEKTETKEDRLSRSLNFLTLWSIVEMLPVSLQWLNNIMSVVFSFDAKSNQVVDLNRASLATCQSNPHIVQLLRVIYSSTNEIKPNDKEKYIVERFNSVLDFVLKDTDSKESFAKQFKFFVDFWTVKFNLNDQAIKDELLDANLDLLVYHLTKINATESARQEFKSNRGFTSYYQLMIRLAREYKAFYKQQLLDVYFAQVKNELDTDLVSLMLNISSIGVSNGSPNHHQINSLVDMPKNQSTCSYLVNLNQETNSDPGSEPVISFFRPVLEFFKTSRSADSNYGISSSNRPDHSLLKSVVARETARIDICILVLLESALAQFNTGVSLIASEESLLSDVEDLFIEFNCDLNTLSSRIGSEQVIPFFNSITQSATSDKSAIQRTRANIVSKVCRFALSMIHKIIVKQATIECNEDKKQILRALCSFLFTHINRSLDTQIGVGSLIKLYESDKLVDLLSSYMNTLDGSPESCLLVFINKLLKHNISSSNNTLEPVIKQIYTFLQLKDSFSRLIIGNLKSSGDTNQLSILRFKFELNQLALLLNQSSNNTSASSTASYLLNVLIDLINNRLDDKDLDLAELIQLMDGLASASEQGHLVLLKASCNWLSRLQESFQSLRKEKPGEVNEKLFKTISYILAYISDLLSNSSSGLNSQLIADMNDLESTKTLSKLFASQLTIDFDANTLDMFNSLQKQLKAAACDDARKDNAQTPPVCKEKRNSLTIARIKRKRRKTKDAKETLEENYDNEFNGTFDEEDEVEDQDWQNEDEDNEFYDDEDDEDENDQVIDEEDDLNASTQQFNLNEIFEDNEYDQEANEEEYDDEDEEEDQDEDDDGSWYNDGGQNSFDETYNDQDEFSGSDYDSSQQQTSRRGGNKNNQHDDEDNDDDETENQDEDDDDDDEDDDGNDYPEDDDDFVEVDNGQSSSNGVNLSQSSNTLTIQQIPSGSSNAATASSNNNAINDLLYVVEDEDDEEDEEARNYVIATGGGSARGTLEQELIAENEDDEEGDEDEEEEEDDDYGDEFNDNLNDYEHIHPASSGSMAPSTFRLVQPSQISAASSTSGTNTNRDLIYQNIISQITTANPAFNNNGPNNTTSYMIRAPLQPQPPVAASVLSRPNLTPMNTNTVEHLDSRLCTYTITKKDFMNQHWYYCHTCMMVDRTGVCSVCARVCHKGHDLSYAKYGSFFCDCGAKEDGSCKALAKRDGKSDKTSNEPLDKKDAKSKFKPGQAKKRRTSHPNACGASGANGFFSANNELNTVDWIKKMQQQTRQNKLNQLRRTVSDQDDLSPANLQVVKVASENRLYRLVRSMMLDLLLPIARSTYVDSLLPTPSLLARRHLATLNGEPKPKDGIFDQDNEESSSLQIESQQLFVVTLGSQEGAFEHVRATYSGDDGATLKPLVQSHQIRRSSMCCMSSGGVKQHLIVTHEKNKSSHFTILQLNALLKQDSQRRSKLTLTKLNTVSVPFTLVGCVANSSNPNYVALTGLKDCMVMYLNEQGQTSRQQEMAESAAAAAAAATTTNTANGSNEQKSTSKSTNVLGSTNSSGLLVLQPALEGSNYIVKPIWLPGSRSELAIVTADFVKIYDLSVDKIAPIYYFLLPMGKIRDVTFVYDLARVEDNDEKSDESNKQSSGLKLSKYKQIKYIVIMSSCGLMYYEAMNEVTSARHGVYYVTNTIDMISSSSDSGKEENTTPKTASSSCDSSVTNGGSPYGSGVSVYYSFKLKLLFWSYQQGKSFMGSFKPHSLELSKVYALMTKQNGQQSQPQQALCNWSEINNHPGLVMCMTLTSNNPVIMMFLPNRVYYQEIKLTNNQGGPTKVKIQDMVAIRHVSSKLESKTTMIILCDDGSLKIYVADSSKTEYWLQPQFKQTSPMVQFKAYSNKVWPSWNLFSMLPSTVQEIHEKRVKLQIKQAVSSRKQSTSVEPTVTASTNQQSEPVPVTPASQSKPPPAPTRLLRRTNAIKRRPVNSKTRTSSQSQPQQAGRSSNQAAQQLFDIDYLEKCAQINDFDIGGNDILEIYNIQHIKSRLQLSNSKSIVMNNPDGFSFEISYSQANPSFGSMLLIGCRIHVGIKASSLESVPQYFEVCNRRVNVSRLQRGRWIDICLTRDEAIVSDNKIVIKVGPSQDSRTQINCLDGLIVYAKSRDELGWSQAEFDRLKKAQTESDQKGKSNGKTSESKDKKKKSKKIEKDEKAKKSQPQNSEGWLADYEPKLFDRVLSQSLEIAEQCLVLTGEKAEKDHDTPHTISSQLLALICPPLVSQRAKSLLFNSLAFSSTQFNVAQERASLLKSIVPLYQSYKDEATLQLVSTSFNTTIVDQDYLDQLYDYEQLQRILLICKSLINEFRANNLVTFLGHSFKSSTGFITYLNSLFWRCVDRNYTTLNPTDTENSHHTTNATSSIGQCELNNLNATIEALIEVMHSFLIVEAANKATNQPSTTNEALIDNLLSSPLITLIVECYLKLVGSSNLDINFISRRTILNLLKTQPVLIPSLANVTKKSPSVQAPSSTSSKSKAKMSTKESDEPVSSSSVDEKVQLFPNQTATVDNTQVELEIPDEYLAGEGGVAATPGDQHSAATAAAQFASLAPFNLNDEEEMLQLAMALSLNEANNANASGESSSTQPPPILPRQSLSNMTKPSKSLKSETTSIKKESDEVSSSSDTSVHQIVMQQPPAYLLNINPRLVSLRKVFLTKLADRIDAKFLIETFCSSPAPGHRADETTSGLKCVGFFQCILNLMGDLNPKEPGDKHLLDTILQGLLGVLQPLKNLSLELKKPNADLSKVASTDSDPIYTRSPSNEMRLLCLRTISILLSKSKYQRADGAPSSSSASSNSNNCNFVIQTLLCHLTHFGLIDMCMQLLRYVLNEYWRKIMPPPNGDNFIDPVDQANLSSMSSGQPKSSNLIKFSDETRFYEDLAPFFVPDPLNKDSFVIPPPNLAAMSITSTNSAGSKSENSQAAQAGSSTNNKPASNAVKIELFDNYVELLTEILIRLPYQMKKLCLGTSSNSSSSQASAVANQNVASDSPSATSTSTHHQQYQLALNQIATTAFDFTPWTHYLCEYLMLGPQCYFLKRLIKKLLQILCGSKDKYRKLKDNHILNECSRQLIRLCPLRSAPSIPSSLGSTESVTTTSLSANGSSGLILLTPPPDSFSPTSAVTLYQLSYLNLLRLIEQLKMMAEIANARTSNWQRFVASHPRMLVFLFELALLMGVDSNGSGTDSSNLNGMTSCLATASTTTSSSLIPTILQLLILSLSSTSSSSSSSNTASRATGSSSKSQPKPAASQSLSAKPSSDENSQHGNLALTHIISAFPKVMSTNTLSKFIRTYLLEAAQISIRWQTHAFLASLFNKYLTVSKSLSDHALHLFESLMRIWPEATSLYGPKAAQYVDLVGYMAINLQQPAVVQDFLQKCIVLYKTSLQLVSVHPNAQFYQTISPLIGASFDGYYLEPEPCFACNQLEQSVQNYKLNSIKSDCRFTTSQQLFKLNNTYAVHKLMIKISDIRKSKMIARVNVYYTTRQVQSIVDLKMNPQLWLKAKRVNVQPAQTEIKFEFALPLIASALIIEYVDFYDRDSLQIASSELTSASSINAMLQCPRCSALVAAHPGVCNTCGENVFQCHKCRAINYDERDPFLCNSCGFCKFAKFEFTVVGRVHCTAEPIENDEDRKQTIQNISGLLERVDKVYGTIYQQIKPTIESILLRHNEQSALDKFSLLNLQQGGSSNGISNIQNADLSNLLVANNPPTSNTTGVIGFRLTPLTVISNAQQAPASLGNLNNKSAMPQLASSNNRLIQSLIQKYSIDCKSKFDELARLIIKLNLSRKELREYDKQFKTTESNFLLSNRSNIQSRKNSACGATSLAQAQSIKQTSKFGGETTKSYCYGCQLSASEHCINLFRALICSSVNNQPLHSLIKTELCKQNILEDLIDFSLKQHRVNNLLLINGSATPAVTTQQQVPPASTNAPPAQANQAQPQGQSSQSQPAQPPANNANNAALLAQLAQQRLHDRDIVNLIYMLMVNNPEAGRRFERILLDKLDLFLSNSYHFYSSNPLQNELMLLGSLLMLPDHHPIHELSSSSSRVACWEQQLRLVIHIMLRSLNAASLSREKSSSSGKWPSPIVIEYLTLPCLRMLTHVAKTTTNIPLIAQMVANLNLNKINSRVASFKQPPPPSQSLNRFYFSEPADLSTNNTTQLSQPPAVSSSSFTMPKLAELDLNVFLRTSVEESYYDKWVSSSTGAGTKSAYLAAESDTQLAATKTKYFAAWRKYTLKKRKQKAFQQQQSKSVDSSSENNTNQSTNQQPQTKPRETLVVQPASETPTTSESSVESTIKSDPSEVKPTSVNETIKQQSTESSSIEYRYDLKMKWLRACIFCPSSKSVRQLSCQLIQSLFTFYSQLPQQQSTSLSSSSQSGQQSSFSFALDSNSGFMSLSTPSLMNESSVQQYNARKLQIAELLCDLLDEACSFSHMGGGGGDICFDYLNLLKLIVSDKDCKYRLVLRLNILNKIAALLIKEIKYIDDLERSCESATSLIPPPAFNLTLGYSVKMLVELLNVFLKEQNIKNKFKHRLVGTILNSYLSLKRLVYERSRLIDEAQEKLLGCLEQMTSGTEQEQRRFMHICIQTVNNFDLDDLVTPVFIFERLCQIIYPEESGDKEFLLVLDKDPNQEDYLQGRMLGNPYNSSEPGLGPLMRNIKNKICTDCELVALLDDDNGMELLVNNKIISLDLPVKDVYKKVWLNEVLSEHEPMRIVYRMTGLSGDATEDIVDSLTDSRDTAKNDEDTYKMALELAIVSSETQREGALAIMLERMACINQQNFTLGKPLLSVLLKLFDYALKLSVNRQQLIKPEMKAITTMLHTLNTILLIGKSDPNKLGGVTLAEELIHIMEIILSEASHQPPDVYNEFAALCGDTEQLEFLLSMIKSTFVRTHSQLLQALMRLVPFLSFGDEKKMQSLIAYFKPYYTGFDEFDSTVEATSSTTNNEYMLHLECFCVIVNGIEAGEMGKKLRDMMHSSSVLQHSIDYLLRHSPQVTTYLNTDYDVWKDFITRRSLPYVLRLLTGLCRSHEAIQDLIGESCIPLLHKLEQFSSGNQVGILAEDLLVALKQNNNSSSKVAAAIEQVRTQTKNEKKKLAMAKRNKELSQLGMKANEKGQLVATDLSQKIKTIQSGIDGAYDMLGDEEKGHVCCICREGYKYHPQKVLAIYTFTKKSDLEGAYEARQRKTVGFSTVTHFNLVHIDCHTNAIRSARTCRDEWENAALQNANTKCNGMLPIWGPNVTETVFSNALAKHNSYLLDATGIRDVSYVLSVHDLKLLMLRFSENLSFSEDSGGGGRESNINLIPYMVHSILYSINTVKYVPREERYMTQFLEASEKIVSNSFECDNVFYYLSMALCIMKPSDWKLNRVKFLKRILLIAHTRLVNTPALDKQKLTSTVIQEFKKYKPSLLFLGLVSLFFKHINSKVIVTPSSSSTSEAAATSEKTETSTSDVWTESFATYIRNNDVQLMESCTKVLKDFEEELIPCEDWLEMFDVMDFLNEVNGDPMDFFQSYLQNFNK